MVNAHDLFFPGSPAAVPDEQASPDRRHAAHGLSGNPTKCAQGRCGSACMATLNAPIVLTFRRAVSTDISAMMRQFYGRMQADADAGIQPPVQMGFPRVSKVIDPSLYLGTCILRTISKAFSHRASPWADTNSAGSANDSASGAIAGDTSRLEMMCSKNLVNATRSSCFKTESALAS